MEKMPLVSVIVPTFRRADKLPRALNSVMAQTYSPIEVVVANDNPPNTKEYLQTVDVLSCYSGFDQLNVIETGGTVGGGKARNLACAKASGEYLTFLDDDDEFLPDKVESQLRFMLENNLDMCWQDISWYSEDGKLVEHRRLDHCTGFSHDELLRAHLRAPIAPTSIYMLKKALFDRTEGFGEVKVGQDWWLMLRCIEAGGVFGYMPEVHVKQYLHNGDRLSLGKNKVEGTELRYEEIKKYYSVLSKADIRYVNFWHYAVLAAAMKRSGEPLKAIGYAAKAFIASPLDCVRKTAGFLARAKNE